MTDITDADREAAAKWAKMQGRNAQAANMLRGSCDTAPLVQAFARHRLAAIAAAEPMIRADERERCAKVAETTKSYDDALQRSAGCGTVGQRIAAAIRGGAHE